LLSDALLPTVLYSLLSKVGPSHNFDFFEGFLIVPVVFSVDHLTFGKYSIHFWLVLKNAYIDGYFSGLWYRRSRRHDFLLADHVWILYNCPLFDPSVARLPDRSRSSTLPPSTI
jgi:hypothetical protein